MKMGLRAILASLLAVILPSSLFAGDRNWFDTYYQYRIPVEVQVEKPGWVRLPLAEKEITQAVNAIEELQYDPNFLAYNYLKVVEVGKAGEVTDADLEAGFYLVPAGEAQAIPIPADQSSDK